MVLFLITILVKRWVLDTKYCCSIMVAVFCFTQLPSYPSSHISRMQVFLSLSPSLSSLRSFRSFPSSFFSFLIFWHCKMPQACIIFFCLRHVSNHFSKEPQYLPLGHSIQKPKSGCYLRKLSFKKRHM